MINDNIVTDATNAFRLTLTLSALQINTDGLQKYLKRTSGQEKPACVALLQCSNFVAREILINLINYY